MKKRINKSKTKSHFIKNEKILFYSFLAVLATSLIGSYFTKINSWYESVKPAITPPSIVFPIVWTTLFILIAISMYFALTNSKGFLKTIITKIFLINLCLNILWSWLFFTLHMPTLAFIDLILMWISIIILIKINWKTSKLSSWLLLPYALWVTFAGLLNYLIAFY